MKELLCIALVLAMVFAFAGCAQTTPAPAEPTTPAAPTTPTTPAETTTPTATTTPTTLATPSVPSVELTVAAATSLTDVTKELVTDYAAVASYVKLTFTYGSSGTLQTQIENGAPADIFLSAAAKQMDALDQKDLLDKATRVDLLKNKVVLIVPKDSALGLKSFEDAATANVKKIALGDPASVPAGQYAEEAFTSLKIWDAVKAKANLGSDVRQVLTWVETGEVDCGVVYATDTATSQKITVVCEAPAGSVKDVIYPAAVLKATKNASDAAAFLTYLKSDRAAKIFEKYGFSMA